MIAARAGRPGPFSLRSRDLPAADLVSRRSSNHVCGPLWAGLSPVPAAGVQLQLPAQPLRIGFRTGLALLYPDPGGGARIGEHRVIAPQCGAPVVLTGIPAGADVDLA